MVVTCCSRIYRTELCLTEELYFQMRTAAHDYNCGLEVCPVTFYWWHGESGISLYIDKVSVELHLCEDFS